MQRPNPNPNQNQDASIMFRTPPARERTASHRKESSVSSEHIYGAGYHGLGVLLGVSNHQVDRARANEQNNRWKRSQEPENRPVPEVLFAGHLYIVTLGSNHRGEGKPELNGDKTLRLAHLISWEVRYVWN